MRLGYSARVVGQSSTLRFGAVLAGWLLAGVALAQQGLILEPWPAPRAAASAPALPSSRSMPESGLPPASSAVPSVKLDRAPAGPVASAGPKWSPPVVTLLVDPWERRAREADPPHPRWLPQTAEIVDPWASARPATPPRVAARPADPPARSTIF
jgi:hypothetical protein